MAFFGFGKKEKDKMKTGLEKTRTGFWGSIMNTLTGSVIDDEMYDDLEEKLILADVGGEVAVHLVDKLRDRVRDKGLKTGEQAADALRDIIAEEMTPEAEMAGHAGCWRHLPCCCQRAAGNLGKPRRCAHRQRGRGRRPRRRHL